MNEKSTSAKRCQVSKWFERQFIITWIYILALVLWIHPIFTWLISHHARERNFFSFFDGRQESPTSREKICVKLFPLCVEIGATATGASETIVSMKIQKNNFTRPKKNKWAVETLKSLRNESIKLQTFDDETHRKQRSERMVKTNNYKLNRPEQIGMNTRWRWRRGERKSLFWIVRHVDRRGEEG